MSTPLGIRPKFPAGYLTNPQRFVPWAAVDEKLTQAINYWLCTVRVRGSATQPHAIPIWAVWLGGVIYFDGSPETRHARNLAQNPHASFHLENGTQPIMLDGVASMLPTVSPELGQAVATAYRAKYTPLGYAPEPDQWQNGGLYAFTPHTVLVWTQFTDDPTKFVFENVQQ